MVLMYFCVNALALAVTKCRSPSKKGLENYFEMMIRFNKQKSFVFRTFWHAALKTFRFVETKKKVGPTNKVFMEGVRRKNKAKIVFSKRQQFRTPFTFLANLPLPPPRPLLTCWAT